MTPDLLVLLELDDMEAVLGPYRLGNIARLHVIDRILDRVDHVAAREVAQLAALALGIVVGVLARQLAEVGAVEQLLVDALGLDARRLDLGRRGVGRHRDQDLRELEAFLADAELLRMRVVVGLDLVGRDVDLLPHLLLDHNHLLQFQPGVFAELLVGVALALELRAQLRVGHPVALLEVGDVFVDLPLVDLVLVLLDLALQQALRDDSFEHRLGLRRIHIAWIVSA